MLLKLADEKETEWCLPQFIYDKYFPEEASGRFVFDMRLNFNNEGMPDGLVMLLEALLKI